MNHIETITFSKNWNGKLLLDCFGTVRLHNPGKYAVGKQLNIEIKNTPLGIATVEAVRTFPYRQITDALSYIDVGQPAHYLSALLSNMYKHRGLLLPSDHFDHVILRYNKRVIENHQMLWRDWWEEKQQQLTLFE